MCYDITSALYAKLKYARHRGDSEEEIAQIRDELENWLSQNQGYYHVRGFSHPKMMVFTNDDPLKPQAFRWGLIPGWVKDNKSAFTLWNSTLNARGETIWEKPSFRNAAKNKRCLIYIDAYYEFHHLKGKTYPFRIAAADESPLVVAGLWEEWVDKETGELIETATMVTTAGNQHLSKIHNSPKLECGPRMPVFLSREEQNEWLIPCKTEADKAHLDSLIRSYPDELLTYKTSPRLAGKEYPGNIPAITEEYKYPELSETGLFDQ
jgi:putative SOS response-associated peptidase YedK